ncbi:hypothetical protein HOD38_02815 [archaeon]|nr:hypothetical protein [archaeon]MBT4397173.1 hypothetical protein [archaeon]MBT4440553.1 hypothetical protein [archaeon]
MNKVLVVVMLLLTLSLLVTGCATADNVDVEDGEESEEEEEELEELEGDMEFEELDEDLGDVI